MKTLYGLFVGAPIMAMSVGAFGANLANYSDSVAAHNIATMGHMIFQDAARIKPNSASYKTQPCKRCLGLHKHSDRYGEMLYYGEYGDDTGVLPLGGRLSGADININEDADADTGNNFEETSDSFVGLSFGLANDAISVNANSHVDASQGVLMASFGMKDGADMVGIFGGYTGGHISHNALDVDDTGGFVGLFTSGKFLGLDMFGALDLGYVRNSFSGAAGDFHTKNLWAGAAARLSYDIAMDYNITLRPSVMAEYMFVDMRNRTGFDGTAFNNKGLWTLGLTPGAELFHSFGHGWALGGHVYYVMNFENGGETYVNDVKIPELDFDNYFDYGADVERTIDNFNVAVRIGRHDGARNGWNGGVKMKYVF